MRIANVLTILVIISLSTVSFAQLATSPTGGPDSYGYRWKTSLASGSTLGFNWRDARSGARTNFTPPDDYTGPVPIGFTFNYYGSDYTEVWISTGGFIDFTSISSDYEAQNNDGVPNTNLPNNIIAADWTLIQPRAANTESDVYYQTTGSSPYRKFIVQWHDFTRDTEPGTNTFQIILSETTNEIVINYMSVLDDSLALATVGIENSDGTDGLQFANNSDPAVTDSMAILWYGDDVNSATASINPDTVLRASTSNEYVYRITGISSSTPDMGKADHVVINNPFVNETGSVVSINVDGASFFIQRSQSRPTEAGFASWWYYPTGDSLVIKTSYFAIRDSIVVTFLENGPTQTGSGNFTSTIDASIGTDAAVTTTNGGYTVAVLPGLISYYTVTPSVLNTTAGTVVTVTARAYDAGNNLVNWDDTTTVEFLTTGTRVHLSAIEDNLTAGEVSFSFADSAAENLTFTARSQLNPTVSGTSAPVTVGAAGADTLLYQAGNGSITAGTNQLLRVAVTDTFGNVINGENVNFIIRGGNGNLEGSTNIIKSTNTVGVAEATLTSDSTAGLNEVTAIVVSSPEDSVVFSVTGTPGGISYYTVTPAVFNALAGDNISVVVRGYDGNNNLVSTDNLTQVELIGSSGTVVEVPASQSVTGGVATFQVSDNVVESYTLTAQSVLDPTRRGTSGVVTISANVAENIAVFSGSGVSVVAGTDQLLRSRVTDIYGNVVNNESIRYRVLSGGGNLGGLGVRLVSSGANGIAEATLTTGVVAGTNQVAAVVVSSPEDSVVFSVTGTPGGISYYTVTPAVFNALAGDNISVVVRGYDGNNNLVSTDNLTQVELIGSSGTVVEVPASQSVTGGVATFQVSDNVVESYTLTAQSVLDPTRRGTSGVVTISANVAENIAVFSGSGVSVVAGTDQLLRSRVTDIYGNVVNNESIRYRVLSGGGNLGGLGVRLVSSGANGIAEATLTTGVVAGTNQVAAVVVSSPEDSVVFSVTGTPGGISYYTVTPAVFNALAGDNISVVVRGYDGNNNLVSTDNLTQVELIGSSGTVVEVPASQSVTGGVATFQVSDNVVESYTLTAQSVLDPTRRGTSGVVTISANVAENIAVFSGSGVSVVAGTDQLLRSRVTDIYGNVVNNESIRYRVLSGGGNLGGLGVRLVSSGANGIAEATLTTGVVAGTNQVAAVVVSSPEDSVVFSVTGTPGGISYYTVTPAVFNALAGDNISVVVRGYDGNNNLVSTDNLTQVELIGSSGTVVEVPASQSVTGGVATFQVSDNVVESYTLTAQSVLDPTRRGTSGVVTISANVAENIAVFSGSGVSVVAGTDQLLRSRVTDIYGNVVNNESIRYRVLSGGGNLGGLGVRLVSSGANGIAEATLTTGVVAGTNQVAAVVVSSPEDSVVFSVTGTPGGISYYTVTPAVFNALAGDNISVVVRGYDGNNNLVSTDNLTQVELIGSSGTVVEVPASQSVTGGVATFQVSDNVVESYTLTAQSVLDPTRRGTSGVVTISANVAENIAVFSGSGVSVVAGTDQLLRSRVTDIYGNVVNNESIRYRVLSGGGNLGGLGVRLVSSGANGIAEAALTTGVVAGTNQVAAVVVSSPEDSVVFSVTGTPGGISYYTVTPAVFNALAGDNISVVVRGYDGNNNLVSTDNLTQVELIGSSGTVVEVPASQSVTGGVATFQVSDNVVESYTLTAQSVLDPTRRGTSGVVTISANVAENIAVFSGSGVSVVAGTDQLLRSRVTDIYGNVVNNESIRYRVLSGGGNLGGLGVRLVSSGANGIAEAALTTGVVAGTNQVAAVVVSSPEDSVVFSVTGTPGGISYYTVTPAVFNALAGDNISVVVRGYDGNNNLVSTDNLTQVELIGSSGTVVEVPASQSVTGGVATFQVSDNVVESYTLTAQSVLDPTRRGTSGVVTISANVAENIAVFSGSGVSVVAGTDQLLRSRVTDIYGNVVNNESIRYRVLSGGGNLGGLGVRLVSSGANGIAEAALTTGVVAGTNQVAAVVVSSPEDSVVFSVTGTPGGISYYTVTPAVFNALAGDNISVVVRGYDGNNNLVSTDNLTQVELIGSSGTVVEVPASQSVTGGVATFQVSDNVVESYTLTAQSVLDPTRRGTSGVVTISANVAENIAVFSGSGVSVVAGTDQLLRSRVTDIYGNVVNNESIRYRVLSGGGNLGGLGVRLVSSGANGIAEATLTTGVVAGTNQVAAVVVSSPEDSVVFSVTGTPGGISYYTVTPAVFNALAGDNISVVVRGYDGNNNLVSTDNLTQVELIGSSGTVVEVPASQSVTGGVATFQVSDNVVESYTLTAQSVLDPTRRGTSGVITITPNSLDYVRIRTAINNQGIEFGDSTITVTSSIVLYTAGYDQYGNYRSDVTVNWSGVGLSNSVSGSGSSHVFSPTIAPDAGRIIATSSVGGVTPDSTGIITINSGTLAELRIQTIRTAGQAFNDTTLTTDQGLILYAVGYDLYGNYLGTINANWFLNAPIGQFITSNLRDSIVFDPTTLGSGLIRAVSLSNPSILDYTGLITINTGNVSALIIRDAPNGAGIEFASDTILAGGNLHFYSAGYDVNTNYVSDVNVNWRSAGTVSGLTDSTDVSNLNIFPTIPGSGFIYTTNASGWSNDSTGTIIIQPGSLRRLAIRTGPSGTGIDLDTLTRMAGDSLYLYAAGYDLEDNYLGDQRVLWSVDGDSIGFFTNADSATSNRFYFRTVNAANFRIRRAVLGDISGLIKVRPTNPDSIIIVGGGFVQTGSANSFVSDPPRIQVIDRYRNPVPGLTVNWTTPSPSGQLIPPVNTTDNFGLAGANWRLRSSLGADTAYAIVTSIPDTAVFNAIVGSSSADSLILISGNNQTGTVGSILSQSLVVRVLDSLGNPVSGVTIAFGMLALPTGGGDFSLNPVQTQTNASGIAQTIFTIGSKIGNYIVLAANNTLDPGQVLFQTTALADVGDSLIVYSGNQQAGVAGTQLSLPVRVRLVDRFLNPVSGGSIDWSNTADGDTLNAGRVTNSSGYAQANWILRTLAGNDTLYATSFGVAPALYQAAVVPDAAVNIASISGNNRTTIAGSGRLLQAEVRDQYNNLVSNRSIGFLPAAHVSNPITNSNSAGIAQSVYFPPANSDSSIAQAYIVGANDTTTFNVYNIRYNNNSLNPKVGLPGDTLTFYANFSNPGQDAVILNPATTFLSFSDGINTTIAQLDSPLVMPPRSASVRLKFINGIIAGNFIMGNYTPAFSFDATSGGETINGTLYSTPAELSIESLNIRSVTILGLPDKTVSRGDTIPNITMVVQNNSTYLLQNLNPALVFNPDLGFTLIPAPTNPVNIPARAQASFTFAVSVPAGAPIGNVQVDGYISGNLAVNGNFVYDNTSILVDSFTIISAADVSLVNYTPQALSTGQLTSFEVTVSNTGDATVLLNQTQTRLTFGTQTFSLDGSQAITAGTNSILRFTAVNISLVPGSYAGTLILVGTENGTSYRDTLITNPGNELVVQSPSSLVISSIILSDINVSQGEQSQNIAIRVRNAGNAVARINSANDLAFDYNSTYTLTPSGTVFPLIINGGDSSLITYTVNIGENAVAGADTFRVAITYQDQNSGSTYVTNNPGIYDTWTVLNRASLHILTINAIASRVSQGQSGLTVQMQITNTGQVGAIIGAADSIGLRFLNNNNIVTLTAPILPATIGPLSTQQFNFTVTMNAFAATGLDSIRGFVIGRNQRTGAVTTDQSPYLDSWLVQSPPQIVITSVRNNYPQVNRGQQNLVVEMQIRNQGLATASMDTAGLYGEPAGSIIDSILIATLKDSLQGGERDTILYNVDISNSVVGDTVRADGFVRYRDANNLAASYVDSGAVTPKVWRVGDQAALIIDSVYAATTTMTLGQSGIMVNAVIGNTGDAPVQLNTLQMTFDNIIIHPILSAQLLTPNIPYILDAGQRITAQFRVNAGSTPVDSGFITLNLNAYGTDQITGGSVSILGSLQPDSILLQTPADVRVFAIANPAAVRQGQNNITTTLNYRNFGQARAQINAVALNFRNGNTYYNRELLAPTFPLFINGGQQDTATYEVDVLSSAPLGIDSLRGSVQYQEINRTLDLSHTSAYLSSWQVFGSGGINILAVQADLDTVSTGQDSIRVLVRVANSGNNPVVIDSVRLHTIRGLYIPGSIFQQPGTTLDSAATTAFQFLVQLDAASPSGVEVINASIYGRDTFGNSPVSDFGADTTTTWLIQRAVNIVYGAVTPILISRNQVIQPNLQLQNTGQADLDLDTSLTRLQVAGQSFRVQNLTIIPGNSAPVLQFNQIAITAAAGMYAFSLRLVGHENYSSFDRTFVPGDSLRIQTAANIVVQSLVTSTDTVTQNLDTTLTLIIGNTGQASVVIDTIRAIPYGSPLSITPGLPFTLNGSGSQSFNLRVLIPNNAPAGNTTISSQVFGYDTNSGQRVQDVSGAVTDSWLILTQPNVTVDSIFSVPDVVQGQSNILVNLRIVNSGQTAVQINSLNLISRIGLYTQHGPSVPFILNGNSTRVLVDTITVANNSAVGYDTLQAQVSFTNRISGVSSGFTSSARWIWQVQSLSNLEIASVITNPQQVSRGQNNIPVTVTLRNIGGTSIRVDSLLLMFANGNSNYTTSQPVPLLPLLLNAGTSQNFTIQVSVQPAATLGIETIDARVRAFEVSSGQTILLSGAVTTDSWTVQTRPVVVLQSTTIAPDVASTGQTGLSASLTIVNQSGATARLDSVDLNMMIGAANADGNFIIARRPIPSLPLFLAAGQSTVIDYNVSVTSGAAINNYLVDGFITYSDINDNQLFNITTASSRDTLDVQNIAVLNILSFNVAPDTVSWNQDSVLAIIQYRNGGVSPARIENISLTFSTSDSRFQRYILDNRSTPFILTGNSTDTIRFYIIAANGILGDVMTSVSVSGIDVNSHTPISANAQHNIFLQTPADPLWLNIQPAGFGIDTTIQLATRFYNNGQASIDLDSTRTTLNIVGTPYFIPLSSTSDQTLTGLDSTTLIFRETLITGVPAGDYPVLITLVGYSNGSSYVQEIEAGQITIGGQVIFGPARVSPGFVLQGQQNVSVIMQIENNGAPLTIDSLGTTLIFKDEAQNELLVSTISRADTLTILQSIPNNELRFLFDVPQDFPLGRIYIFGQISLNGGNIIKTSLQPITSFRVLIGAKVSYIGNTLTPANVVPRQNVPFTVTLYDSGTASLTIVRERSYLEFGFSTPLRTYPSANFVLLAQDSSQIEFQSLLIPAGEAVDNDYSVSLRVVGVQISGDTLRETLSLNTIRVLMPATINITNYNLVPVIVRQGQKDIQVDYTLQNTGHSNAEIKHIEPRFRRTGDNQDVSANWISSALTPTLPDILPVGNSRPYSARFTLDTQADTGVIVMRPDVWYSDQRTPVLVDTFSFTGAPDTVLVVVPASLKIDSLIMVQNSLAPNRPNVNVNRPFNLRLFITNSGSDTAKSVTFDILRNNNLLNRIVLTDDISPTSQYVYTYRDSIPVPGNYNYLARIISAIDATTGQPISIGQPENNTTQVHADLPAVLTLNSAITTLSGELDSTVAVGQRFYVRLNVTSSGTAYFTPGLLRLNVPANYQILSGTDTSYTFANRSVAWLVRSLAQTPGSHDTLVISRVVNSIDQNTGQEAVINSFANQVLVNSILTSITINSVQFTSPVTNDSLIVSTDQDSIRIDARITIHPLLSLDRQVKLELPPGLGYTTQDTSLIRQLLNVQQSVYDLSWFIRAPKDACSWSPVILSASAKFSADPVLAPVSNNAALNIQTVTRANIVVTAVIVEPAGALDGIVSEGQRFRIRADISRTGDANIVPGSQGLLSIQADDTLFSLCSSCADNNAQKTYTVGDTVSWWIDANVSVINKNIASPLSEILSKLETTSSRSAYDQQNNISSSVQNRLLNELSVALKQQDYNAAVGSIGINLDTTPLDENTFKPANASLRNISLAVTTEQSGVISIAGGSRPDTVSAGQTFTYTRYFDFSDNVNNTRASLLLPPGLNATNPMQNIPTNKELKWDITVADTFRSAVDNGFTLLAWAIDNNSGATVQSSPVNDTILVQPFARVRLTADIISPITANNGLVSVGQRIQIRTNVERDLTGITGMADVTGPCRVEITLPAEFNLPDGVVIREFNSIDASQTDWEIVAPAEPVFARTVTFTLIQVPNDKNSNKSAFVGLNNGRSTFSISAQSKVIVVTNLSSDSLLGEQNFRRGQQNAPLLAFEISNEGFAGAENDIYVDSLFVRFVSNSNETIHAAALQNLLESITVVNYEEYRNRSNLAKPPIQFAEVPIDNQSTNPLDIGFDDEYEILAGDKDTVVVLANFSDKVSLFSFKIQLTRVRAYDVDSTIALTVTDPDGNGLEKAPISSGLISAIPSNTKESFKNFPNPFGRDDEITNILFYLENTSDVEIRIFTLTGGLVWTKKLNNTVQGVCYVPWDGKNDRGKTVLNGVYLCQLQIKPVGGGSTQVYITKIAYLK